MCVRAKAACGPAAAAAANVSLSFALRLLAAGCWLLLLTHRSLVAGPPAHGSVAPPRASDVLRRASCVVRVVIPTYLPTYLPTDLVRNNRAGQLRM
ncbi:hypothetical protein IWX46DRAFT_600242 [Phyllosticta citricarpa]|uniref:Secreted protein n=1 Tax=Phyllosticta citricarpa TaxID=55181 RepID=A0ABR1MDC5_9PEZI